MEQWQKDINDFWNKEGRKQEIQSRLNQIDVESIRPIRAIQKGVDTQADIDRIVELEIEAEALRKTV